MSIQDATYKVCRGMQDLELRKELNGFLFGANFSTFGQAARTIGHQFAGMLIADEHRDTYSLKLDELSPDQRILLEIAQKQLDEFNAECCAPILDAIPSAGSALNPNSQYKYTLPDTTPQKDLIPQDGRAALIAAFHAHPAIEKIQECLALHDEKIEEDHFLSDVVEYETKFLEKNPLTKHEWLYEFTRADKNEPRRLHTLLMFYLLCFRDSLRNTNQLMYQACFLDRITALDDNSLIDVSPTYSNTLGSGVAVVFHSSGLTIFEDMLMSRVNEIILLLGVQRPENKVLGRIEASKKPMLPSQKPIYVELRLLDENMCAYGHVLRF